MFWYSSLVVHAAPFIPACRSYLSHDTVVMLDLARNEDKEAVEEWWSCITFLLRAIARQRRGIAAPLSHKSANPLLLRLDLHDRFTFIETLLRVPMLFQRLSPTLSLVTEIVGMGLRFPNDNCRHHTLPFIFNEVKSHKPRGVLQLRHIVVL